jgi:undecaprenyl-diphosphatase
VIGTRLRPPVAGRLILLAAFLVAFAVVLAMVELKWGPVHRLDVRFDDSLHRTELADPDQAAWWRGVSTVLSPTVLRLAALAAAVALWVRGRRPVAGFVVVAMAGAAVLETIGKAAVGRHRPVFEQAVATATGASFPSGHALTSFVAFGLLVVLTPRRLRLVAGAVAVIAVGLVGFSRLALGVHYPSDVVGGWLLGAAWLVGVEWIFRVWRPDGAALTRR